MDDIDLPPIANTQPHGPKSPTSLFSRKRPRSEYDPITSSDPPLFSSDDHIPSAENYSVKRHKQKWKGTWWGEKFAGSTVKEKRTFTRNFDSGVFMGSESTEGGLEDEFLEDQKNQSTLLHATPYGTGKQNSGRPIFCRDVDRQQGLAIDESSSTGNEAPQAQEPSAHDEARAIVHKCLEDGHEDVDLSSLLLKTLPPDLLEPLHSLTKYSAIQDPPSSQEAYKSLEANLRLYLGNNSLQSLPLALFGFSNLRFLSVRHNDLTELPPVIGQLRNLETLNVANNKLEYLPYEVIELVRDGKLTSLTSLDNPWLQYETSQVCAEMQWVVEDIEFRKDHDSRTLLVAKTPPEHLDANGLHPPTLPPRPRHNASQVLETSQKQPPSPIQSLTSMSLLKCSSLPEISHLPDLLAEEVPPHIHTLLQLARRVRQSGGRTCATCRRPFIIPRLQWIEWWGKGDLLTHQKERHLDRSTVVGLPVLRMRCSLGCGVG